MLTDHLLIRRAARELDREPCRPPRSRRRALATARSVEHRLWGQGRRGGLADRAFRDAAAGLARGRRATFPRSGAGLAARGRGDRPGRDARIRSGSCRRPCLRARIRCALAVRGRIVLAAHSSSWFRASATCSRCGATRSSPRRKRSRRPRISSAASRSGARTSFPRCRKPRIDRNVFEARLSEASAWLAALRDYLPAVPRLIATSLVAQAKSLELGPSELASWFEANANEADAAASSDGPLHVYRRSGELVQAHVVPLAQFLDLEHTTVALLLRCLPKLQTQSSGRGQNDIERTREGMLRTIRRRDEVYSFAARADSDARTTSGRAQPAPRRRRTDLRRAVRTPQSERVAAKDEASALFARYKKANAALPRVTARRQVLERERAELETLAWEIERADAESLEEIESDLERKTDKASASTSHARKIVAVDLPSGARLYIGRSPRENAEITFSIARPDDLWFHARNVPGAHVVLATNDRSMAGDDEIATAASIAAYNSKPARVLMSRSIIRAASTCESKKMLGPAWCGTPTSRRSGFRRARTDISFCRRFQRLISGRARDHPAASIVPALQRLDLRCYLFDVGAAQMSRRAFCGVCGSVTRRRVAIRRG